jgi:hypothetical protein
MELMAKLDSPEKVTRKVGPRLKHHYLTGDQRQAIEVRWR